MLVTNMALVVLNYKKVTCRNAKTSVVLKICMPLASLPSIHILNNNVTRTPVHVLTIHALKHRYHSIHMRVVLGRQWGQLNSNSQKCGNVKFSENKVEDTPRLLLSKALLQ